MTPLTVSLSSAEDDSRVSDDDWSDSFVVPQLLSYFLIFLLGSLVIFFNIFISGIFNKRLYKFRSLIDLFYIKLEPQMSFSYWIFYVILPQNTWNIYIHISSITKLHFLLILGETAQI